MPKLRPDALELLHHGGLLQPARLSVLVGLDGHKSSVAFSSNIK